MLGYAVTVLGFVDAYGGGDGGVRRGFLFDVRFKLRVAFFGGYNSYHQL